MGDQNLFKFTIDFGQVILGILIATIAYFMKRTIDSFASRLDKHDSIIITLVADVQRLIGSVYGDVVQERRIRRIRHEDEDK